MITVSEIARLCGLSRSTILYYESVGLLKPAFRGNTKYRFYGEKEVHVLRQIRLYRSIGLSVERIRSVLSTGESNVSKVLQRRLRELDREIEALRGHQEVILRLLQNKSIMRSTMKMTKDKWVSVMKAAGFKEEDMHRWHQQFELNAPAEHEEFLQFLHIPSEEIRKIREWSRKGAQ